jgi:hypothetical protein
MTPELAQLLDGKVAARWGRPGGLNRDRQWVHECPCGAGIGLTDATAEALWLSHLLRVCGERGWPIKMYQSQLDQCPEWWFVEVEFQYDHEWRTAQLRRTSLLEALARAMLAIPAPVNA